MSVTPCVGRRVFWHLANFRKTNRQSEIHVQFPERESKQTVPSTANHRYLNNISTIIDAYAFIWHCSIIHWELKQQNTKNGFILVAYDTVSAAYVGSRWIMCMSLYHGNRPKRMDWHKRIISKTKVKVSWAHYRCNRRYLQTEEVKEPAKLYIVDHTYIHKQTTVILGVTCNIP